MVLFIAFQFVYPDVSALKKKNPKKTAFMSYREKEWKRDGKKHRVKQKWVSLKGVSPYLVKAVLISEDDKFWSHEGFDYEAMQKAIEKDVKAKKFKLGGSTISQQLAKNLYLSPSKNPIRKIREAIITWRMERALSKRRILELYLNVAEWGDSGIFGIETASRKYYGKSAADLGPEEASRLASVLPNPRRFNPIGSQRYVIHRSNLIYNIMVRRGIVVPEYEEVSEPGENTDEPVMTLPESPLPESPVTE
jgi:monofunctional biosynthetic peptidoglycan transglycosylase